MAGEPAIDKNFAIAEHAVEFQPDAFAGVFLRQLEGAAIPGDVIGREARSNGFEPMAAIGALVKRQFHHPIVREVHGAPARVAVRFAGGAAAGAGLGQALGQAPLVAEVKFPAEVEQQPFARRGIGVGGKKAGG